MNNFKKYQVQRGDTIESIAKKIGIPAAEIKAFHNQHSEVSDLVEIKLPLGSIKYILLPNLETYVENKLSEQNAIKKVFSKSDNNLRLTSVKDLKIEYGTIIHYKENNQLKNKIHFTSKIEFIKEENDFFTALFQINQVYINDKEPELVIEKLADKISKVLYPVKIALNSKGELHSILNIHDIQRRWEIIKPSIIAYYKGGSEIGNLISSFEKNIKSASLLKRSLEEHPFFQIYFAPIYREYTSDLSFVDTDSQLKIVQNINEFQTSTSKVCLSRKGIAQLVPNGPENIEKDVKKSEFEIGKLEEENISNMSFLYKLHDDNKSIFSITGFINSRKTSDIISTIEFETYENIKKKTKKKSEILTPISQTIDWSADIINKQEIKEKGVWDIFWGN